jgi:hypothetical protein
MREVIRERSDTAPMIVHRCVHFTHTNEGERRMEERLVAAFDDLGIVNGARVSVRLVHRRGQLLLVIRKVRNGAFMPQGIELSPDMLNRFLTQGPRILAATQNRIPRSTTRTSAASGRRTR